MPNTPRTPRGNSPRSKSPKGSFAQHTGGPASGTRSGANINQGGKRRKTRSHKRRSRRSRR